MPRKGYIQLATTSDLRRFTSKLINERRRGDIDSAMSRDCGYLIKLLMEIMQSGEFEERLEKIEMLAQQSEVNTNG